MSDNPLESRQLHVDSQIEFNPAIDRTEPQDWLLSGAGTLVEGHIFGRKQGCWAVGLQLASTGRAVLQSAGFADRLLCLVALVEGGCTQPVAARMPVGRAWAWGDVTAALGACTRAIMKEADLAVVDPVAQAESPDGEQMRLLLPAMPGRHMATMQAWRLMVKLFQALAMPQPPWLQLTANLEAGLVALKAMTTRTANTPRFMLAAYELNIPVTALGDDVYQYGEGSFAQWFDSTLTLMSHGIGIKMAKNKMATANRLRQAGLPGAEHQLVASAAEAVRLARSWGGAVVIKPADQDGGRGVSAGLEGEADITTAFDAARAISPNVLLEKHFHGRDHRLTLLDGQLLEAIERVPASVVGDGLHTIEQLVAAENARPERGEGAHSVLKRLVLDAEAMLLMNRQRMGPDSIPGDGVRVTLRRIANVAAGGQPVAVNDRVHPDNARLAIQAAQALRLDLAGVDILIPDIAVSWKTSGALICEVNAQPQISVSTGPHLCGEILRHRLRGNGRIPVVVVMGDAPGAPLVKRLVQVLVASGRRVGWMDGQDIWLNDQWLPSQPGLLAQGQTLRTHPAVEAMVLPVHDDQVFRDGLPVDQINWLVLAGPCQASSSAPVDWPHLLKLIVPACRGVVAQLETAPNGKDVRQVLASARCQTACFTEATLLAAFSEWVEGLGIDNLAAVPHFGTQISTHL